MDNKHAEICFHQTLSPWQLIRTKMNSQGGMELQDLSVRHSFELGEMEPLYLLAVNTVSPHA